MPEQLTDKQKKFCEEYLIDLNATQAAIRAGYSKKTARSQGQRMLTNVDIQNLMAERQKELQTATGITQKRVLDEFAKIAFIDIRKFYGTDGALKSIQDLDDDAAGALASVESYEEKIPSDSEDENIVLGTNRKIKTFDKVRALDSLARHLGIYKDRLELSGHLGIEQITGMQFKKPTPTET